MIKTTATEGFEPVPAPDDEPAEPAALAEQPRRLRVAALLNRAALLCTTTALAVAIDPKIPPFRSD